MKRDRHQNSAPASRLPVRRTGSIFSYYMMYLMLTGIMISSAGISLHVVLRSGVRDDAASLQVQTLSRLQKRLRNDERQAVNSRSDNERLTFVLSDSEQIVWEAEGNILHRRRLNDGEVTERDRFAFSRASDVTFLQRSQDIAVVRVSEPILRVSRTPADGSESGQGGDSASVPAVDILVSINADSGGA